MHESVSGLSRALPVFTTALRRARACVAGSVVLALLGLLASASLAAADAPADPAKPDRQIRNMDALSVVLLRATAPKDARSSAALGAVRQGSGIVIDNNGLILTIGYLIVEAEAIEIITADGKAVPATLIGYDHATGFGLVRASLPLSIRPIELGESAALPEREPVLIAGFDGVAPAFVVSKRQFAGYWEYLLDSAIFTAPVTVNWSGAALIGRDGKLYGVGSLVVTDAVKPQTYSPGNMFVPIDLLKPILGDLIGTGRVSGPARPWIGVNTQEMQGHLVVTRVTRDGPAEKSGLKAGDIILRVGEQQIAGQVDFYKKLWSKGPAGTEIALSVLQGAQMKDFVVHSMDRAQHVRTRATY
ncbi:MAG: serine protease [Burkholderiales bacterium]|nr:serine protease [Burkholderiales bacterium]